MSLKMVTCRKNVQIHLIRSGVDIDRQNGMVQKTVPYRYSFSGVDNGVKVLHLWSRIPKTSIALGLNGLN